MNVPLMEFAMKHNGSLSIKRYVDNLRRKESFYHPNKISILKPFMLILTNGHLRLMVSLMLIFGNTRIYEELLWVRL